MQMISLYLGGEWQFLFQGDCHSGKGVFVFLQSEPIRMPCQIQRFMGILCIHAKITGNKDYQKIFFIYRYMEKFSFSALTERHWYLFSSDGKEAGPDLQPDCPSTRWVWSLSPRLPVPPTFPSPLSVVTRANHGDILSHPCFSWEHLRERIPLPCF